MRIKRILKNKKIPLNDLRLGM